MKDRVFKQATLWARKRKLVVGTVVRSPPAWGASMEGASDGLPIDVDADELGLVIRQVLERGLTAPPLAGPDDFEDRLARRFGLKDGRRLYAGVRCVGLTEADGWLTCTPTRHRRGFDFEAFPAVWKDQQPIRVASGASDAEWGAAALEALRRSV